MKHRIAGDAGIIDQDLDRPEIGADPAKPGDAGLVVRNIPFIDWDPGLGLELGRDFVVAVIDGSHFVAGCAQPFADRRADAARATTHHRYPSHGAFLSCFLPDGAPCLSGLSTGGRAIRCPACRYPIYRLSHHDMT